MTAPAATLTAHAGRESPAELAELFPHSEGLPEVSPPALSLSCPQDLCLLSWFIGTGPRFFPSRKGATLLQHTHLGKGKVQVLLWQGLSSHIPRLLQLLGPLSVSGKRQAGGRWM